MAQRRFPTLSLCALAISLVLVGCGKKEDDTKAASAATQKQIMQVGVLVAQSQSIENFVELAGRASAYEVSEVRPQTTGIILKRLFTEGSYVKAGQPLYELDSRANRAAVESAKAAVLRHEANVNALRIKERRYQQLVNTNAIAKQDYDDAVANLKLAEADLVASQANLKSAEITLGYSLIRAPISGQTGRSSVTVGALVTSNQTDPLVKIQSLNPIYIDIPQSSNELLQLRQQISQGNVNYTGNTRVKLTLENGTEYPLEGQLTFADASVNETTGAVTLRAIFPNPSHVLLPGMYATARISQGALPHAYLVPQAAVSRTPTGNATVLIVGADNKVESRVVKTKGSQGNNWIISEGLTEGDKIIVEGVAKVKAGDTVKIKPSQQESFVNSPLVGQQSTTPSSTTTSAQATPSAEQKSTESQTSSAEQTTKSQPSSAQ